VVEFRILGPLEVVDGDRPLVLGGPKQQALLAVLLLHRGETVSTDRLIDQLWGERAPATAAKTVQVYVSNLRKALGDGLLATRGHGYVLAPDPSQVDLDRFQAVVGDAREALEGGNARRASERLREGLAMWRGPPLADFAYEPFAQSEIARLEEARLAALEDRIDADLAMGEQAGLVSELEGLVRQQPLRERLHGQLMLALYRSGRQADALERYQQARRKLTDELGIEPGPALQELERAILNQDPALAAVHRRLRPRVPRRVGPTLALGGALLLAAAVAAMLELLGGGGGAALASAPSDSVVAISTASGGVQSSFPVGGNPTSVAVGAGAVWALNSDSGTVTRIDLRSHVEQEFGTGGVPTDLAAGDGALWVGNGTPLGVVASFPVVTSVVRLDPDTAATLATTPLPSARSVNEQDAYQIAVGPQGVWVINPDESVSRIDPGSDRIVQTIRGLGAAEVAAGPDGAWVVENTGPVTIVKLSPNSDRVVQRVHLPGGWVSSIAVGGGALWATDPGDGTLWRIDPAVPVARPIRLAVGAGDVAYGASAVWVSNGLRGTVSRVDPRTSEVTKTISLGNTPGRLAVGGGAVWVAVAGARGASVAAASQTQAGISALPASVCGQVFYGGGGPPQRLIVSDLPLRGGPGQPTVQMSAAIAYVLRQHDFRAGRFRVGYQSCDDSTSQSGIFDDRKCVSNAKAWVHNPLVVGVIGPWNSPCAVDELPITNRGQLAMISPTNTLIPLTRPDPLVPPDFLGRLYPTGVRNYARVYPADDLQAAATAEFARRKGLSSIYVLADEADSYGGQYAFFFERAARRVGLDLVGASTFDPAARDYGRLTQRVAGSGATAVYVGGDIYTGGPLIRALRQRLGPRFAILTNEGFLPIGLLFQNAGAAARGVYVTTGAVPSGPLAAAAREFIAGFAATQHQAQVNQAAVYAAEATEVMLDAIAHSDGSRPSVTRALLATCVHNGILGSFCFDPSGDPTVTPITILQAKRATGNAIVLEGTDGADVVDVINPPRALIGPTNPSTARPPSSAGLTSHSLPPAELATYARPTGTPGLTVALTLNADGSYTQTLWNGPPNGIRGVWGFHHGTIAFTETGGSQSACTGQRGTYRWLYANKTLTLTLVNDPCTFRTQDFPTAPWAQRP
jgi:DNA-binding SARP family transcriptional activator/ABC-type branched-subunit amino acid transport system substrate-binding protein